MAEDTLNIPISADLKLNRPLSMPPILREKLNKSQIAAAPSTPTMGKVESATQNLALEEVENEVTERLLQLPRASIAQFSTQLYRQRQTNFRPYLAMAAPDSLADPGATTSPNISAPSSATEALARLQTTVTTGTYQFQRGVQLPYMRKSLALSYEHVSLLRGLVTVTGSMAQMLEAKLEAIKLNTSAPESRKETLLQGMLRTLRQQTLTRVANLSVEKAEHYIRAGYAKYSPGFKEHVADPLKDHFKDFASGRTTARDVGADLRDRVHAAYLKAREKAEEGADRFLDASQRFRRNRLLRRRYGFDDYRDDIRAQDRFLAKKPGTALTILDKPAGVGSKYNPPAPPSDVLYLGGPSTSPPSPPDGQRLLEGPAAHPGLHVPPLAQFPIQKYTTPTAMLPKSGGFIDAEARDQDFAQTPPHPLEAFSHAIQRSPASMAGKDECLGCCDDLISRLDNIYALMKAHFTKQEKLGVEQLHVAQTEEHFIQQEDRAEEGPRAGSYQDHLRQLREARARGKDLRHDHRRSALETIGAVSGAGTGILGDLLSGGGSLIQDALEHILGKRVGSLVGTLGKGALRSSGRLLKGVGKLGLKGVGALGRLLLRRFGGTGLTMSLAGADEAAEAAGGLGSKALSLVPEVGHAALDAAESSGKFLSHEAGAVGGKALSLLGKTGVPSLAESALKGFGKFGLKEGAGLVVKSIAKKIPVLGALVGAGLAAKDAWNGDYVGAGGNLASGLVSLIPGIGTAASALIDMGLNTRNLTGSTADQTKLQSEPETASNTNTPPDVRPASAPPASTALPDPAVVLRMASRTPVPGLGITGADSSASSLLKARLSAYGFKATMGDDTMSNMKAIARLEAAYLKDTHSIHNAAGLDPQSILNFIADLGITQVTTDLVNYFKTWVSQRFIPVFSAFTAAIEKLGITYYDVGRMTPTQIQFVLKVINQAGQAVAASAKQYVPSEDGYRLWSRSTAANRGVIDVATTTIDATISTQHQIGQMAENISQTPGAAPNLPIGSIASNAAIVKIITAAAGPQPDYSVSGSSALDIVQARLKAYGFPAAVGLDDFATIRIITKFENRYLASLKTDLTTASVTPADLAELANALGLNGGDFTTAQYFKNWYDFRFSPVYMAYLRAIRATGATPDDVSRLTPSQVTTVIAALTTASQSLGQDARVYTPTVAGYQAYVNPTKATGAAQTPVPASAAPKPDDAKVSPAVQASIDAINAGIKDAGGAPAVPPISATSPASATPTPPPVPATNDNTTPRPSARTTSVAAPSGLSPASAPPIDGGYTAAAATLAGAAKIRSVTGGTGVLAGGTGMAPPSTDIGALSSKYESSKDGAAAIGYDGTGGTSYGSYQIAANTGTFAEFIKWASKQGGEGEMVAQQLANAGNPNGGKNGPVAQTWKQLAEKGFIGPLEQGFIKETHYDAAFKRLSKSVQDQVSKSKALQEVLFSTAVQHGPGGAAGIFNKVATPQDDASTLIRKVYQERSTRFGSSSPGVRASVFARFGRESNDALALAAAETTPSNDNAPQVAGNGVGTPNALPASAGALQVAANNNIPANQTNVATPTATTIPTPAADATAEPTTTPQSDRTVAPVIRTGPTVSANVMPPSSNIGGAMLPAPSTVIATTLPRVDSSPSDPSPATRSTTPHSETPTAELVLAQATKAGSQQGVAFDTPSILQALGNIADAVKAMHHDVAGGKMMSDTNDLLKQHLDKPTANIAVAAPVSAPAKAAGGHSNDLSFSKSVQNAGAAA